MTILSRTLLRHPLLAALRSTLRVQLAALRSTLQGREPSPARSAHLLLWRLRRAGLLLLLHLTIRLRMMMTTRLENRHRQ